jgi:excisionase family DNA binding protein
MDLPSQEMNTVTKFCGFGGFAEENALEKLLTVNELAELLNVAPGSIYHWISQDRLPVVRFSKRCVRFREADVTKLMDELQSPRHQRSTCEENKEKKGK